MIESIEVSYTFTVHKFVTIELAELAKFKTKLNGRIGSIENTEDINELVTHYIGMDDEYFTIDSSDELDGKLDYCEVISTIDNEGEEFDIEDTSIIMTDINLMKESNKYNI